MAQDMWPRIDLGRGIKGENGNKTFVNGERTKSWKGQGWWSWGQMKKESRCVIYMY